MSELQLQLQQVADDDHFKPLANAESAAFVSAAFTPFALAAALESQAQDRPALIVASDDRAAHELAADLQLFLGRRIVRVYPARGVLYESQIDPAPHLVGQRIAALDELTGEGSTAVVVANVAAVAELVPDPELRPHSLSIETGELLDIGEFAGQLTEIGYRRVERVEDRGQFAIRGDLVDLFPATLDTAVRIELFDIEIESLRAFSTYTQRSLDTLSRVEIAPAIELSAEHRPELTGDGDARPDIAALLPIERFRSIFELAGESLYVAVAALEEVEGALTELWRDVEAAYHDPAGHGLYVGRDELNRLLNQAAVLRLSNLSLDPNLPQLRAERPASLARDFASVEVEFEKLLRSGYRVVVAWNRRSELERAEYNLARLKPNSLANSGPNDPWSGIYFTHATLREGFVSPSLKLAIVPDRQMLRSSGRVDAQRKSGKRSRIASFADLGVGDLVVHEDHGIARFSGFDTKTVAGVTRDYLTLEYRGEDKVFLPAEQLFKISRYFGASGADDITLSKLGGKAWETIKARARGAAQELAGELVNLYAERKQAIGFTFSPDNEMQLSFENAFPYVETRDQLDAIDAVKRGMESPRPLDVLVCGDVGFGKTEVALRAAFKAVQDSKQVLVLAPTTILTQQHHGTFSERMRDFPIGIDFVSRFRSKAEQGTILKRFSAGEIDVLIGTHRLLGPDVQPKDLGLIIVDEEQRFGVKQKELLRQLRLRTDVVSLSATPIPRTLQMSMAGLREITVIATAPEGRRPVRTHVGEWDEELIKQALLRERERGGQSLYMHDLVGTIDETADRIRALIPDLKVSVVHGQLPERELEQRMLAFIRGESECLVCTTIVESGLDIPSANTLIVERADKLGLAQAYQIRGRVGRGRERAFAYFLYPSAATITETAANRLATLADYEELGSGFKVAMRDLEIRGAGNLLGDEQSGHIAALGFELYVSMIDAAVAELEGRDTDEAQAPVRIDVSLDAYVPSDYVTYEQAKIEVHRRVVAARELADIGELRAELIDRFGPPPPELERLLALQEIRINFGRVGVASVVQQSARFVVAPIELDAAEFGNVRERLPTALYDRDRRTVSLRFEDQPELQFAQLTELAASLLDAKRQSG